MASQTSNIGQATTPQVVFRDQVLHHINENSQMRADFIRRTNLLRGVIVTPDGLRPSTWDILNFKDELPAASMNDTIYEVSSVKNSQACMFVGSGWSGGAIDVCKSWIFLTCGISLFDNSDIIFGCGFAHRVRGVVDFNVRKLRSNIGSEFKGSVLTALQGKTREEVQKCLKAVFNRFGHLFPTRVWLGSNSQCSGFIEDVAHIDCGGLLSNVLHRRVREWKDAHSVDVDVDFGPKNKSVRIQYRTNGGQSSLVRDASSWLQSTERYQGWVVTKVEKAIPIIELLEPDLCQQVIGIFAPLIGKWVAPVLDDPMPEKIPDMTAHPGWYWLCQTKRASEGENQAKCLIVQDRSGRSLIPAPTPAVVAEDGEVTAYASAVVSGFDVLGAFLWSPGSLPDFSHLCAVKRDFLIQGSESTLYAISDAVIVLVTELPDAAVALGDPVPAIETKHIILQVASKSAFSKNKYTLTPKPYLLSKYAIDIQGAEVTK
ncbi:hypothetical protein EDD17DRAFT_1760210 [Pisolithus thermaeus]|nr:hypothetical protein EV401DRAFT_2074729 [Pisolithus croceorrhizus]KAI6160734.1 hypothetical protein EDD17DRAFT_1760210 [Pisolithus thermaeus]